MANEASIKNIIDSSLEQIRSMISANTVLGEPVYVGDKMVIIPISRVSIGFASGGLDLPQRGSDEKKNFGGGGGTGVTVSPLGFMVIDKSGKAEIMHMTEEKSTAIEQVADLLDHAPQIIDRIKTAITGVKSEDDECTTEACAEDELEAALEIKCEEATEELKKGKRHKKKNKEKK
jgi:sporulation protein YtfJ